jgi:AcrR family transcriptional regulator
VSPRPRKASDDEIFAATYRAMTRLGPGELTLAEIAAEAGLTAGALVQRFGSKRGLLLTLAARHAASAGELLAGLRAEHGSPLAALRAYADCMSQLASSPAAFARSLAYLQIDLTDPEFRKHLVVQARATRDALRQLIEEAVAEGELTPSTDPAVLARTVEAMIAGSMMTWAFYRQGTARRWIEHDVEAVLAPYLARPGKKS